jgi:hypothetical protein
MPTNRTRRPRSPSADAITAEAARAWLAGDFHALNAQFAVLPCDWSPFDVPDRGAPPSWESQHRIPGWRRAQELRRSLIEAAGPPGRFDRHGQPLGPDEGWRMPTNRQRRSRIRYDVHPPAWALRLRETGEEPARDSEDGAAYFGWLFCGDVVVGLPDPDTPAGQQLLASRPRRRRWRALRVVRIVPASPVGSTWPASIVRAECLLPAIAVRPAWQLQWWRPVVVLAVLSAGAQDAGDPLGHVGRQLTLDLGTQQEPADGLPNCKTRRGLWPTELPVPMGEPDAQGWVWFAAVFGQQRGA